MGPSVFVRKEILNCNWIMREFYFGKFLVIKSTGE